MKKILKYSVIFLVGIIIGAVGINALKSNKAVSASSVQKGSKTKSKRKVLYWRAPMNPNEIYDHPGKSNMGMDLVPVYADEGGESGVVKISPVVQQNMNVKIVKVKQGELHPEVNTNGILQTNEKKEYTATTKVAGWIEKLYVNFTGQKVHKGDKLVKIYSPELVSAQEELLTALDYDKAVKNGNGKSTLLKNAIRKLKLLDVTDAEIENLKRTGKVKKYITLYAPFDGTVIHKGVNEGAKINRGTPILKIADLTSLWIIADIYEYEFAKIKLGLPVEVTFDYLPGKRFNGRISFIYPTLDTKTRTIKVRIDLPNKDGYLKPGMFANVNIKGESKGVYPLVPEQAILRSGKTNTVIIALGDGRFKPAQVELGDYANGYYQILSGLQAGTKIVESAQFLIDSESNLRASLNLFTKAKNPADKAKMKMNMKMNNKQKNKKIKSKIIRKGVIDLNAIDRNKDGKVFQDVMDVNVISDKPGTCPICGMTLKEVSIEQAKRTLEKHGFKYKK